jgi:2-oxoisovalerate dehydrogenase E1 component
VPRVRDSLTYLNHAVLTKNAPISAPVAEMQTMLDMALRIRAFETVLLELFKRDLIAGTVHTCVGQELCAAALHPHLRPGLDAFFATHRGHGHYLAHGGPEDQLLAELMGREGALCGGRGGTQNLLHERFFSAGIQGGGAALAVGYAWALQRQGGDAMAVAQIGDGTLGEGTLYEAFTFASLLRAPVLFLLEHNGWAQSTDTSTTTPGDILDRAAGFGLETNWIKDTNPAHLHEHLGKVVAAVRQGRPFLQVVETRRLLAHSKGDDNRPAELIERLWKADPLAQLTQRDPAQKRRLEDAEQAVRELAQSVARRPLIAYEDVPALPFTGASTSAGFHSDLGEQTFGRGAEELNRALHELIAEHPDVVLLGEDLLDPYGGAFKVSRGLSTRFPEQVFSTPIAEAGIAGVANGLALAGLRPIAEIMFADFATLAADQLINFAAKFHSMYAGKVRCPITLRLVSGGGRGYGPTHSQSLETLFCGVPGLRVVALSSRHHPGRLLRHAVLEDQGPKVFVENKRLYAVRPATLPPVHLRIVPVEGRDGDYPPLCYMPRDERAADVTVVTYGGMTEAAEAAMHRLVEEEELAFEYIILTQLWPLSLTEVVDSVRRTRRLVVVEEPVSEYGVGAAVIAGVVQQVREAVACRAVGARPVPLPAVRHLEDQVLPSVDRLALAISEVL